MHRLPDDDDDMASGADPLEQLPDDAAVEPVELTAFEPAPGRDDEHWHYLNRALIELGPTILQQRQQLIRRLLRDNGVVYSALGAGVKRPWLLDPIPLAISSAAWRGVERGLQQRAELWRLVLDDLYGPRRLLQRGLIPAELVFADPRFLRPCAGLPSPGGRYRLPLYAADLAWTPDGTIRIVAERTRSPGGTGYALENRIVLSRVLPSLFREARVHRLALFFRTLRRTLQRLAWNGDATVALLTPGVDDRAYFEHAYLAKYLGYPLVQGGDLTVRDGRVYLKTLDGLQAVDVLLRWLDDADCDPLELSRDSSRGVAGLLQAVRFRRVAVANPVGSGALENPGLAVHLPALCRALLGEDLLLPAPTTYWCGEATTRDHVLANLSRLLLHDLHAPRQRLDGRLLDADGQDELRRRIRARPERFAAREPFTPAEAPVLDDGRLVRRPVLMRSFVVAAEEDYMVMPGGLGRVDGASGATGIGKDVWVLASEPIRPLSLLTGDTAASAPGRNELPSRVAENLFWLGRYAERSESLIRLLRVVLLELLEPDAEDVADTDGSLPGLLRALTCLTETHSGFVGEGAAERLAAPGAELSSLLLDPRRAGSLAFTLDALLNAARAVRDRISPDIWRVLTVVDEGLQQLQLPDGTEPSRMTADTAYLNQALGQLNQLLTACVAFTGLALDSMTHGQGWRFLMIGRRLERSLQVQGLLRPALTLNGPDAVLLEPLLNVCDSLMTYRARYRSGLQAASVLDLLLLDETNPRALGYQLRHLQRDVGLLPGQGGSHPFQRREPRLVLSALTRLRLAELPQLLADETGFRGGLDRLLQELGGQLNALGEALADGYFRHADQPHQLVNYRGEG